MSKESIDKEKQEDINIEETQSLEEQVQEDIDSSEEMENANIEDENASEISENPEEEAISEKKDKKKIFGNKKDKKDQAIEELTDKHQRLMAEFQNFRNRSEKEKTAMFEVGAKSIIEKILPVIDNFERGLASMTEEDLDSPIGQGMNMIYKQLTATLEEMGVKAIEAQGSEFDPELHNAVMHVEDEEVGENMIVEEFQKGYTYRDGVVRHSMVKVAN